MRRTWLESFWCWVVSATAFASASKKKNASTCAEKKKNLHASNMNQVTNFADCLYHVTSNFLDLSDAETATIVQDLLRKNCLKFETPRQEDCITSCFASGFCTADFAEYRELSWETELFLVSTAENCASGQFDDSTFSLFRISLLSSLLLLVFLLGTT